MKLGIISGNRLLPIILAEKIKQRNSNQEIIAFCFKQETNPSIVKYADKTYWFGVGQLRALREALNREKITKCIMAGQINPLRVFNKKGWDKEMVSLISKIDDFRPHNIFTGIIEYLEEQGIEFISSIEHISDELAEQGIMNGIHPNKDFSKDIDFGVKVISKFVELDVGQTIAVKSGVTIALESIEGTDRTIKRAYRLAGGSCTVLKFSKANQDLRFDVPVVGISTLKLLKRIKAHSLVLEKDRVIILEKDKFLHLAKKQNISIIGRMKNSHIPSL